MKIRLHIKNSLPNWRRYFNDMSIIRITPKAVKPFTVEAEFGYVPPNSINCRCSVCQYVRKIK